MNSQENATISLLDWQQMRAAGLSPQQRMERLLSDFFKPASNVRYQDQVDAVAEAMSDA